MDEEQIQASINEIKKRVAQLEELVTVSYRQKLRLDGALQGNKVYYVATGATGVTQTPLTFKDGILTSEL